MNDSMTSVADIPGDADDDLSGISPELVLVDPELARRVREREAALAAAPPERVPVLRLVPSGPEEHGVVPRPAAPVPRPASEPVPTAPPASETAPTPSAAPRPAPQPAPIGPSILDAPRVPVAPPSHSPSPPTPAAGTAPALPATDPSPASVPAPAPAPPVPVAAPAPAPARLEAAGAAIEPRPTASTPPAMPHPVARPPVVSRPARREPARSRPRRRGLLAFIAAVGIASAAVVGVTRLGGAWPPPASTGSGAATAVTPGTPPTAPVQKAAGSKPKAAATAKPKSTPTRTSPTAGGAKGTAAARPKRAQTTGSKAVAKPAGTKAPAAVAPRRFAWAPVAGATGYHVELFRGPNRVFATETAEPALELGSSWRYQGRTTRLTPGSYRWYVWPVTKSGRATEAVVQATLDVP